MFENAAFALFIAVARVAKHRQIVLKTYCTQNCYAYSRMICPAQAAGDDRYNVVTRRMHTYCKNTPLDPFCP